MSRWRAVALLLLSLTLFHGSNATTNELRSLRPLVVNNIGEIGEPSGLTYSNLTRHLYAISDTGSTNYIFELYTNGTLYKKWKIGAHHQDIEAVASDDVNQLLYIAEEERMRISSYKLPVEEGDWTGKNDLIPIDSFVLETHGGDPNSGLEGLAVDTLRNLLYATYEKKPKMFYTLDTKGNEVSPMKYPTFGGDLSGMYYDYLNDWLWIVSDQSKKVYVTDVTASIVYDYWSIPLTNGEGIAIDYIADPPLLYVTTDPSSPSGPPYQPLLAMFLLPEVGTGYQFPDEPWNPPDTPCDGCQTAYEEIMEEENQFYSLVHHQEWIYSSELAAVMAVIFLPFACVVIFVLVRKIQNYDYTNFQDVSPVSLKNEPNPWDDLFSSLGSAKQERPAGRVISHHNFEDEQF